MSLWHDKERKKRKVASSSAAVTAYDVAALRDHYTFVPNDDDDDDRNRAAQSSWQGRMVSNYHRHLYKDCVLADTTRVTTRRQLGLRWRTAPEVRAGRGRQTCGNLQCPSSSLMLVAHDDVGRRRPPEDDPPNSRPRAYRKGQKDLPLRNNDDDDDQAEDDEKARIVKFPHGVLLNDFEVPFTYKEQGQRKTELVKLKLCVRCAPLLFQSKGDAHPFRAARRARMAAAAATSSNDNNPAKRLKNSNDEDDDDNKDPEARPSRRATTKVERDH